MKLGHSLAPLFAALISLPAFSAAQLNTHSSIELLVINGQKAPAAELFSLGSAETILPTGNNQIVFRIKRGIRTGSALHHYESVPLVAKLSLDEGDVATLAYPSLISIDAAKRFDHNPSVTFTNADGHTITHQLAALPEKSRRKKHDYVAEMQQFNKSASPVAMTFTARPPATSQAVAAQAGTVLATAKQSAQTRVIAQPANGQAPAVAGDMLRYWYQQADEQTRQAFLNWLVSGAN